MEELNLDQLEVGEWYEVKASSGWKGWLHKHASEKDGCAIGSIVSTGKYCDRVVDYKWGLDYTFRKATKEQLKSFLPKDHPDYPIENSDYKWMLMLVDNAGGNKFKRGQIEEVVGYKKGYEEFVYENNVFNRASRIKDGKIKPFLTKEEAEKYWDSINVKPVDKSVETPKTKQLSDLKKGDWVKFIFDFGTSNFKENNLYKLTRDWDNGDALIIDANGNSNGFGNGFRSYKKEEWKLFSKAKDKVKAPSTHRVETTIETSPNWYETSINDKPITQFCPQPEETEIVPISKYFKIRN